MNDGGSFHPFSHLSSEAILLRRSDIERCHDYSKQHSRPRDYLIFRLPYKIGLRTTEITTLKIENIDFGSCSFYCLDSKRRELYPLPLDYATLDLIHQYIRERVEGYVFDRVSCCRRKKAGEPICKETVWHVINNIGRACGVPSLHPRTLRQYFAANWIYGEHKSLPTLQRILRHKDAGTTALYIQKFAFFEDIQREYDSVKFPFESASLCERCRIVSVCKLAPLPATVNGCTFFQKQEVET